MSKSSPKSTPSHRYVDSERLKVGEPCYQCGKIIQYPLSHLCEVAAPSPATNGEQEKFKAWWNAQCVQDTKLEWAAWNGWLARSSVLSETPRSEPIAWYTEHDGGGAHCRLTIYEEPKNKVPGVEWIPLYATPVSAVSAIEQRPCTCDPADYPPVPCAKKYALAECREATKGSAKPFVRAPFQGSVDWKRKRQPSPRSTTTTPEPRPYRSRSDCSSRSHASRPPTLGRLLPFSLPVYVGNEYQGMHTVFAADHAVVAECYHKGIAERIVEFFNGASVASATPLFTLDTAERVCFYEQEFYVLSNFSAFKIEWDSIIFDTSEALYHWLRFDGRASHHQAYIRGARSAHDAFQYAQRHKRDQRPDWDAIKVNVMKEILHAKAAQHEYVRRKLLETGDRELVENSWRDPYWGWGPNRDGLNRLGKLWMEVRADLRRADGGKA